MSIKWELSEKCKDCPRCGPKGRNNDYGLGPGVYPKGHFPKFPAHIGCNCHKSVLSE